MGWRGYRVMGRVWGSGVSIGKCGRYTVVGLV